MLRRVLCLAVMLAGVANARADALDELLHRFAAHTAGHATFTEVHQYAMLKHPLRASGELRYAAPDYLEKRTLKPRPETLVLSHGMLTVERAGHRRQVELAAYPQLVPFIESIRATLAGDRGALEKYFVTDLSGADSGWSLRLTPRPGKLEHSVAEVRLSGAGDVIRRVDIRLTDGDHSTLDITPDPTP
ncbi:MAG: outer membrane lipoprotein carrier protein LolA [Gammaproteobacteria bacterium]|nr:outer membrane lipoprotein carrier protein LolA [Gammaproteobacteria bacterium]